MFIGKKNDLILVTESNVTHEFNELGKFEDLVLGEFYIFDDYLYEYIGEIGCLGEIELPEGCIGKYHGKYYISTVTKKDRNLQVSTMQLVNKEEYEKSYSTIEGIIEGYLSDFDKGKNLAKNIEDKLKNTGEKYTPPIEPTDDVMTRLIKLMIRDMGVILNNYKENAKNEDGTPKKKNYLIDNLRSGLNGTTVNTTITKYLVWCDVLGLEWKFEIFNDLENPRNHNVLDRTYYISNDHDEWVDVGAYEKGIFKVPLSTADDPLKKLIKIAVYLSHFRPSEHKEDCGSPHLLNNMMSALKRGSKMMITYFLYWCDILGITFQFSLRDPVSGVEHFGNKYYDALDYVVNYNTHIVEKKETEEETEDDKDDDDDE